MADTTTQNAYKAVFFDLDGTLLHIDMQEFLEGYFDALRVCATRNGQDPDVIVKAVQNGVDFMINDLSGSTNSQRFWEGFAQVTGAGEDDFSAFFDDFYDTEYRSLGTDVEADPDALRAVQACVDKGYVCYLTTMPLFPLEAVTERLSWAGIDDPELFDRITTYDNSTFTKPYEQYFQENVDVAGCDPSEVLVVGNNTVEDLSCMKLGCDAFVVLDDLIDENEFDVSTVKNGTLHEFADWCDRLPAVMPDVNLA